MAKRKISLHTLIQLFMAGGIFILIGYFTTLDTRIDKNWHLTTGRVTEYKSVNEWRKNNRFLPSVQYSVNGNTYSVNPHYVVVSYTPPEIGSLRTVAYNPENPAESKVVLSMPERVKNQFQFYLIGGVAIIIFAIGYVIYSRMRR